MILHYEVVTKTGEYLDDFEKTINDLLREGLQPYGPLVVVQEPPKEGDFDRPFSLFQVMVHEANAQLVADAVRAYQDTGTGYPKEEDGKKRS